MVSVYVYYAKQFTGAKSLLSMQLLTFLLEPYTLRIEGVNLQIIRFFGHPVYVFSSSKDY